MTYIRKYLMLTLAAFLCVTTLRAQVDNQYTQYYMVPGYYNPSAIGNTDYIHVTVGSRAQWVGIKHAPLSFVGLADMPFKFLNKRFATGVSINQTSMGLYSGLNASAQLAYKHKLFGGTLSGGIQVGLVNEKFLVPELSRWRATRPTTPFPRPTFRAMRSTSARAFSTSTSTGGQVSQPRTSHNPRWR